MPDVALQLGRCIWRPLVQRTRRKVLRGQANTSGGTGAAYERKAERLVQCDDVFGDGIISCFVLQIVQPHRWEKSINSWTKVETSAGLLIEDDEEHIKPRHDRLPH